jgi:periplasmic protein CpxP/Spy
MRIRILYSVLSRESRASLPLAGIFLASALCLAPCAVAQAPDSAAPQPATPLAQAPATAAAARSPHSAYRRRTMDDRVKSLAQALNLDEKQQAGVKTVLERQQLQARKIQFDPSLDGAERIGKFRALQEDTASRIRALLNDEQKQKYDPLNHAAQNGNSSDTYVDQWMKNHQQSLQPQPAQK